MGSYPVQWTADTGRPSMKDMGVDHRHLDVAMPQQLLVRANVRAAFEQVCGKGVPECVAPGILDPTGPANGVLHHSLQNRLVNVMPSFLAGPGVLPSMLLGKDLLPAPVLRRVGILTVQGVGQQHASRPEKNAS